MTTDTTTDTTSFDAFFDASYDDVVRTLSLITHDRARAEDAAQDAFAVAYRKWSSVARLDRPAGYVVVTATNRLKRWFATEERRLQRFRSVGVEPPDGAPDGRHATLPDHASTVVLTSSLHDALAGLPPRQRATVVLRYLCDLSNDEVAKALGCTTGTVKSALHSALASLKVELADIDRTDPSGPSIPARRTRATTQKGVLR